MKIRISRKLKNIILSIVFAVLIFLIGYPNVLKMLGSVGVKMLLFFLEGHKNSRVGTQKQGQTLVFIKALGLLHFYHTSEFTECFFLISDE